MSWRAKAPRPEGRLRLRCGKDALSVARFAREDVAVFLLERLRAVAPPVGPGAVAHHAFELALALARRAARLAGAGRQEGGRRVEGAAEARELPNEISVVAEHAAHGRAAQQQAMAQPLGPAIQHVAHGRDVAPV